MFQWFFYKFFRDTAAVSQWLCEVLQIALDLLLIINKYTQVLLILPESVNEPRSTLTDHRLIGITSPSPSAFFQKASYL